jgi:hypothetical protein
VVGLALAAGLLVPATAHAQEEGQQRDMSEYTGEDGSTPTTSPPQGDMSDALDPSPTTTAPVTAPPTTATTSPPFVSGVDAPSATELAEFLAPGCRGIASPECDQARAVVLADMKRDMEQTTAYLAEGGSVFGAMAVQVAGLARANGRRTAVGSLLPVIIKMDRNHKDAIARGDRTEAASIMFAITRLIRYAIKLDDPQAGGNA